MPSRRHGDRVEAPFLVPRDMTSAGLAERQEFSEKERKVAMNDHRRLIKEWRRQGRLPAESVLEAMRLAGVVPTPGDWRRFIDHLLLWLGVVFVSAGVVFFFAHNWQTMGRFLKFALAETLIAAAVVAYCALDREKLSSKASLLAASLLIGALLALVGQTYQTGADPWELFAVWALMILPWVAVGRFDVLWLLWVGLLNLATYLYLQIFRGLWGMLFGAEELLWAHFYLNTLALAALEGAAYLGVRWLGNRWVPRVLVSASGGLITVLAVWTIFEFDSPAGLLGYFCWMGIVYGVYRYSVRDLFVLAGQVLSLIVVVTSALARGLLENFDAGGLFFIGLAVIGMSAGGGIWLRAVAKEFNRASEESATEAGEQ